MFVAFCRLEEQDNWKGNRCNLRKCYLPQYFPFSNKWVLKKLVRIDHCCQLRCFYVWVSLQIKNWETNQARSCLSLQRQFLQSGTRPKCSANKSPPPSEHPPMGKRQSRKKGLILFLQCELNSPVFLLKLQGRLIHGFWQPAPSSILWSEIFSLFARGRQDRVFFLHLIFGA